MIRWICLFFAALPVLVSSHAFAQATTFQYFALREIVNLPIAGRDGVWAAYIFPGSPYVGFGDLGGAFSVGPVCAPNPGTPGGGIFLSAGQGFGDMVAYTPTGSPFNLGETDPSGKTELCNPLDTDDTWWFAYGDSLNLSPLLTGRFHGNNDVIQIPTCSSVPTPVEGIAFLERRSADRQVSDTSCIARDPNFPLRLGTVLFCEFTNTWLDAAGNNQQTPLRACERYLACVNTPFGGVVPRGLGCSQATPGAVPPPGVPGGGGPPPVVQCSTTNQQGGDTADTRLVELAKTAGTFKFDFDTFAQQDRIVVSYQGQVLFDTGCVGTSGSQMLTYSGASTQVQVVVSPNCAGGSGTAWTWTANCP